MLSRVADSLYWMSRYLERAEHTVRMLDVNFSMTLDPSSTSEEGRWKRVLAALGNPAGLDVERKFLLARPCACVGQKQSRRRSRDASPPRARMQAKCARRSAPSSGSN